MRRLGRLLPILAAATLAATGCGGSGDEPDATHAAKQSTEGVGEDAQDKPLYGDRRTRKLAQVYPPGTTYASACGNTSYLAYQPTGWSTGCTGGSFNLDVKRWLVWTKTIARGEGAAGLRGACHPACSEADAYYRAPGEVILTQPRTCQGNSLELRYFAVARYSFYARPGNPVNEPVGWRHATYKIQPGACILTR